MFPPVFPILTGAAAVVALVGAPPNARIYEGEADAQPQAPYIVWLVVDAVPEQTLDERPSTDRDTFQVDCYAATAAGLRQLTNAVRDALEQYAVMTGLVAHERGTTEPRLFRAALQFDYFSTR